MTKALSRWENIYVFYLPLNIGILGEIEFECIKCCKDLMGNYGHLKHAREKDQVALLKTVALKSLYA